MFEAVAFVLITAVACGAAIFLAVLAFYIFTHIILSLL